MEGDEEGDICRVCRTGGSPDRPLNYPCKCSGSIRFIHQDCLMMWLTHSKTKYCELCGHHFEFTPIYAENAPSILPPHEIVLGLLQRASVGIRGAMRVLLVVLCWFIIVPIATSTTFYIYFGRPIYGFSLRHLRVSTFVMDCAFGTFVSAMVIFVCLLIMSLMDFVNNMHINENNHAPNLAPVLQVNNHPPPPLLQPQNGDQQHGGEQMDGHNGEDPLQNEEQHNFGNNEELLQNHLDPLGGQEANDEDYDAEIDGEHSEDGDIGMLDAQGESDEDDANDHDVDDVPNDDDPDALIAHYNEVMAMFDQIPHHADFPLPPPPAAVAGVDNGGAQGVGEGEQMEEEENLFGNMFFGILDGNAGEVDFNELVGLAGPLTGLLSKVVALVLFNACFLALFALIPLVLGRFLLHLRHHPVVLWEAVTARFLPEPLAIIANVTLAVNNTSQTDLPITDTLTNATTVNSTYNSLLVNSTNIITSVAPELGSGDIDAVVIGYLFIALFCMAWTGITLSLSASFALSRNPFYRTILRTLKLMTTAVKVACVMFSELGLFPLLVGNALDFCTLSLFGASFESRLNFCRRNPLICQTFHWGVGFAYMILFASFVGWVREVVRPGVLWFFRDPSDPNFNPLKDIVDQPASRHVKRLLLSAVIYAVIIGLVVQLPILVGKAICPSLFPLNIWLGDPFYEGPIDLIFVHIIVPYTLEYCHPKANFKTLLRVWIVFLSHKLGVVEYMLPPPAAAPALPPPVAAEPPPADPAAPAPAPAAPEVLADPPNLPNPPIQANPLHEQNVANPQAILNQDADAPPKPRFFWLRVFVMLNCAWMSMFVLNSLLVSLPIIAGRFMFSQLSFPLTNDLYTFCAGFYAFYGFARATHAVVTFMTSLPVPQIVSEMYLYCIMGFKCAIIGLFLGIVIPGLIGLVFELVFAIPWRVAVDQSPHFFIYQDWGLGLIYMKIWYRLIVARTDYIRLHPPQGRQEWYDLHALEWKAKIDQIFYDGFRNLHITRIFTTVVFPILDKIFLMLCIPYVFAKGVVPLLGGSTLLVSAVYRYGFLGLVLAITITQLQGTLIYSFRSMHNAIRDDKYLVGRRLHNYMQ